MMLLSRSVTTMPNIHFCYYSIPTYSVNSTLTKNNHANSIISKLNNMAPAIVDPQNRRAAIRPMNNITLNRITPFIAGKPRPD